MIFNEVRDTFLTFNKYHIFHQPSIWFCSQFRSSKLLHFVDQNNCQILVRLENSSPNFIWYLILLPSRKQLFCRLKTITLATVAFDELINARGINQTSSEYIFTKEIFDGTQLMHESTLTRNSKQNKMSCLDKNNFYLSWSGLVHSESSNYASYAKTWMNHLMKKK